MMSGIIVGSFSIAVGVFVAFNGFVTLGLLNITLGVLNVMIHHYTKEGK